MEWVIFINHRENFRIGYLQVKLAARLAVADICVSLSLENFPLTFGIFFRPMHHVIFNFKSRYNILAFIDLIYPFISYKTYLSFLLFKENHWLHVISIGNSNLHLTGFILTFLSLSFKQINHSSNSPFKLLSSYWVSTTTSGQ